MFTFYIARAHPGSIRPSHARPAKTISKKEDANRKNTHACMISAEKRTAGGKHQRRPPGLGPPGQRRQQHGRHRPGRCQRRNKRAFQEEFRHRRGLPAAARPQQRPRAHDAVKKTSFWTLGLSGWESTQSPMWIEHACSNILGPRPSVTTHE